MKRSPGANNSGCGKRSCAQAVCPGGNSERSSSTISAMVSAVKQWKCTRERSRRGRAPGSSVICASARRVVRKPPGAARVMPRARSSRAAPARFSAVRWPARASSAVALCTWIPRTRRRRPEGNSSSSSSLRMLPESSVPVTTVPKPFTLKTRSMGRRASACESRAETRRPGAPILP